MTQTQQEEVNLLKELIADTSISADERTIYEDALSELMKSEKPKATTERKRLINDISEKATTERKPRTTTKRKPQAPKQSKSDIESAKAEIKRRTGKTEEECESIVNEYRSLRAKSQERKKKETIASAENKDRVAKLKKDDKIISGTSEKTADAVIETTTKDVAEKIVKEIDKIEQKAEVEATKEVKKEMPKESTTEQNKAIAEKTEEKVKEKTKTIVKRIVIDTSSLLSSIAESLGKFDKDSQKEFLIKLRSDIDKLLTKYSYGGATMDATQTFNITQSNMSSSSVNPSMFKRGGGVRIGSDGREYPYGSAWALEHNKNNKNENYEIPLSSRKNKRFNEGGYVDLFEDYENIPNRVQVILDKYADNFGGDGSDMDYKDTRNMLEEVEAVGYTFGYGLDNEPYGLRPMGVRLNQLKGYEDFDDNDFGDGGEIQKVNLGNGEMDLDEAIKIFEEKIKAQGRVVTARDEDMLEQLKRMKNKFNGGGGVNSGLNYGKKDDVFIEVITLLNSKLEKPTFMGKQTNTKQVMSVDSFMDYIKKYEMDERYEVNVPIELFTKESFNQYSSDNSKLKFITGSISLLGKEDLLKKYIRNKESLLSNRLTYNQIEKINDRTSIKNAPEKTTIVQRIVSKQLLENGGGVEEKEDYFFDEDDYENE